MFGACGYNGANFKTSEQIDLPSQFTHSIKLSDTAKGIRIDVHVYTNDRQTAINEVIETYLKTKQKCEMEKIQVAPSEIIN